MYSSKAVLTAARPAAGAAVAAVATATLARLLHILALPRHAAACLGGLPAAREAAGGGLQAAAWASMSFALPRRVVQACQGFPSTTVAAERQQVHPPASLTR